MLRLALDPTPVGAAQGPRIESSRQDDVVAIHASADLAADRDTAWRVLTDYGRYADFIPDLSASRVVSRTGTDVIVEQSGKAVPALGAGGHYDPGKTGKHLGPYADGHLGDLPPPFADAGGRSTLPVLAPRLKLEDLKGRSLMVHAGGDNFSDQPDPLGGGGPRVACGIVK